MDVLSHDSPTPSSGDTPKMSEPKCSICGGPNIGLIYAHEPGCGWLNTPSSSTPQDAPKDTPVSELLDELIAAAQKFEMTDAVERIHSLFAALSLENQRLREDLNIEKLRAISGTPE